jgi:membrane protein YdbS with pleckstrin-like domain
VLVVSIVALIVGATSVTKTCQASAGDNFAFIAGIVCVVVGAVVGLGTIAQAIRRRRVRPDFWWYIGSAAACAATIVVGTFATASGFTLCIG